MGLKRSSSRQRRTDFLHHDIPFKANRILHIILVALCLVVVRVWYLSVVQYEQKLEESQKPQRKTVIEPAIRATIRDRFNLPLAINKISYQAAILYSQLKDIPSVVWKMDDSGKRMRVFKRREYIKQLSQLLGQELQLDPERIEDLIHSKASYYAQVPFVIKDEITEEEYYRLKMMEREWPGIHMSRLPKRDYPRGRTAADIIGYMGAINRQEYEKILHEMKALQEFLRAVENREEIEEIPYGIGSVEQAEKRLRDLEEKAYTIHDYVGKTGIEGVYEEKLRGFYGKKNYFSDSRGNFLWELPGSRASLPGHRILLSISAELQEYAEQILAQNEEFRIVRKSGLGLVKKTVIALKSPWIKGGAIVAMDPSNGEVLALASFPRFDPNDYISSGLPEEQKRKRLRINRWFENEHYIAQMWNLQQPFERERFNPNTGDFYDEARWLSWSNYLDFVLPVNSQLRKKVDRIRTLHQAIDLQKHIQQLIDFMPGYDLGVLFDFIYHGEGHEPARAPLKGSDKMTLIEQWEALGDLGVKIKQSLDLYIFDLSKNYDKILLVDLMRLLVREDRFSSELLQTAGRITPETYREASGALTTILGVVKELSKEYFHDQDFRQWRKLEEKAFLKQKRLEEKQLKTYPKPYLDYLDKHENHLFNEFWGAHQWSLVAAFLLGEKEAAAHCHCLESLQPYLHYLGRWEEEITGGAHQAVDWNRSYKILKKTIRQMPPQIMIEFLQTMRGYQDLDRPLYGRYKGLRVKTNQKEKHLAAAFYPLYGYGCGRSHAYRQATIQGSLFKVVTAYEALKQRYQKIGSKNISLSELNPLIISDEEYMKGNMRYLGHMEDGRAIPQLYKGGRLPRSLAHKNTGRVDLVKALEYSSNPYFAVLAGDCLDNPNDLAEAARQYGFGARTGIQLPGEIAGNIPNDLASNRTGLYAMSIGQHSLTVTPLQTAVMMSAIANGGKVLQPKIVALTAGRDREIPVEKPSSKKRTSRRKKRLEVNHAQKFDSQVNKVESVVKRELFMPEVIQKMLLKGLYCTVQRTYQESLGSLTRLYQQHPEAILQFNSLKNQLVGKTSTSESVEFIDLDSEEGTNIYTHVWFGSISYDREDPMGRTTFLMQDEFGQPELVVVVYLRYGGYGKEAAPLAAQIVKKWRELKKKYQTNEI